MLSNAWRCLLPIVSYLVICRLSMKHSSFHYCCILCKFTGSKERSVRISFPICNDMPDLMVSVVPTSSYSGELMHFLPGVSKVLNLGSQSDQIFFIASGNMNCVPWSAGLCCFLLWDVAPLRWWGKSKYLFYPFVDIGIETPCFVLDLPKYNYFIVVDISTPRTAAQSSKQGMLTAFFGP